MTKQSSATDVERSAVPLLAPGVGWGLLGVLAFSVSLPATRLALRDLDPVLVGIGRSAVAALLAGVALAWAARRGAVHVPSPGQLARLAVCAGGVVFGFPMLTSWALESAPAAHGAVVVGLLPTATAVIGTVRTHEVPSRTFVLAGLAGLLAVLAFGAAQGGGRPQRADLLLLLAVLAAGVGYVEGGLLARAMPPWQVTCWALVVAAPVSVPVGLTHLDGAHASAAAWGGFAYTAVVSSLLGFFAWYRGLAIGGIARVGQIQLVQPVLSLGWAALLVGESVGGATLAAAGAIVACAVLVQRTRPSGAPASAPVVAQIPVAPTS